ncbi:Di-copper centre-containing protein [Penicillium hordei]|uniref:tyrosinase n=1 Tax=Penicillium hordei TaxID=40994 RepID=A0AAD6DNG7_9EURO|nr:Di-copper centre-containing protein [Penicillium hordei]KAJ5589654.1 Di-copper centre-containing protein [Penicillium hordei]
MTIIVKGIETRDANGKPYLRQDIDKWYMDQVKDGGGGRIQLTLFVEALALIQKRPLDNLMSYFRLAAIHSAPWCKWDDVDQPPENPADDSDRIPGYCVHNNYTFPTWHRVYMMLYEASESWWLGEMRALYDAMYEWIGTSVPADSQDTWKKEADKWRLPYWDFARFANRPPSTAGAFEYDIDHDRLRLPILCMMPSVQIIVFPKDKGPTIESLPNPLYKYVTPKLMGEFPTLYKITGEDIPEQKAKDPEDPTQEVVVNPKFTYPWDKCNATTKYGILDGFDASIWADGGQNWLRANYALNEHPYYGDKDKGVNAETPVPTLQDLVYRLFQYGLSSWGAFSTTRYTSNYPKPPIQAELAKDAMNLEFIHNNLHVSIRSIMGVQESDTVQNFVGGTQFLRPPKEDIHLWGAGHMSSVFMAAFDPIFFIYHNNIDRLTAMWQILNWEKWFDDTYSKPTKDNKLTPFHKDANRNFWKSDDVRDWRALGYEYEILQERTHDSMDDRKKILENIAELYGNPTKNLFDGLPKNDGDRDDFVITVVYDKYALNGASYKINLFLNITDNFGGPESEGFVASIYNFSGSLDSSACGNCQQQKAEGVKCIAQVPATVPMRRYLKRTNKRFEQAPEPIYRALNGMGIVSRIDPLAIYAAD